MTCSDNACGTGIGTTILPGDPDNNSILTASPAFGGIEVSWTLPSTNAHGIAYTKIWRGLTPSFNSALMIAAASGDRYFDRFDWTLSNITMQYYWIEFVSINGTVNAPIGPAAAVPRQTIDQVIDQLTAKIDYNMLSVDLKGTVDKAELYKVAQETVNNSVAAEQISIRDALALVQQDIDGAFVLISNEVTARQSAGQAFASSLNTLAVSTGENLATAQTELQTFIDELDNKVGALYTAKVTVDGLIGGFGIYNDGTEVDAGFDVDTFWVGRSDADKVKPFIISDGVVYLDQAVIKQLDADKINAETLSAITVNMGSITAGTMQSENGRFVVDLANAQLCVFDDSGVLRVKIGNLSV